MDEHGPGAPRWLVVAVDDSPARWPAVEWAAAEAAREGMALRVLNVTPERAALTTAEHRYSMTLVDEVRDQVRRTHPELKVATESAPGSPVTVLIERSQHAEQLVLGVGGWKDPARPVLGSVGIDVAAGAACPVVVVRGPRPERGRVLIGIEELELELGRDAVTAGFEDARRYRCPVLALHVRHGLTPLKEHLKGTEDAAREAIRRDLTAHLRPWTERYPDITVEVRVVQGDPTTAVLGAARAARLVVVGSHGRSALLRGVLGSTSTALIRRCPSPLKVVGRHGQPRRLPPVPAMAAASGPGPGAKVRDRGELW